MPKRETYIKIRLFEKVKKEWEGYANNNKFASLSQLIRYVISEYIEHGFTRFLAVRENDSSNSKTEELKKLEAERDAIKEEREKYFKMFNEVLQERRRLTDIKIKDSIKGKILKWLDKFPNKLDSEEIAELIGKSEPETLDILNKLEDQILIKLNKNMKYQVINNQDN